MDKYQIFIDKVLWLVNRRGFLAVKNGMIYTMPLTTVGAFFLIVANLPIPGATQFFTSIFGENWQIPLNQVIGATFDIVALISAIGIAYAYCKESGVEPLPAGVISFSSFLIITKSTVLFEGNQVGGVIPKEWTGGKGIICAIIVGLVVGVVYTWLIRKNITIKMPPGVPPAIASAFIALIPATLLFLLFMLVFIFSAVFVDKTFIELIYAILQVPLQGITDSFFGAMLISFLMPFFWLFGVHGSTLVGGIMGPMTLANTLHNKEILDQGIELTIGNGAKVVTLQFMDSFINMTGAGLTIGLVICMAFLAKSKQYKDLGKLSLIPGIFNINEPVLFGFPIVLNPLMAIPFVLNPLLVGASLYLGIQWGWLPPFGGVTVPWIIPPVASGFLLGSWKYAVFQLIMLIVATFVYFPFFKIQDRLTDKMETNN